MKRLLLIVIVILLLAGIGAGVTVYLGVGPLPKLLHINEKSEEAATPAVPPPPRHSEVSLGGFVIPVVQNHAINRSIGLDIAIDVMAADEVRATAILPLLQNAFVLELFQLIPRYSDANSPADKKAIHDRLVKVAEKVMGPDLVKDVIIKSIYDR